MTKKQMEVKTYRPQGLRWTRLLGMAHQAVGALVRVGINNRMGPNTRAHRNNPKLLEKKPDLETTAVLVSFSCGNGLGSKSCDRICFDPYRRITFVRKHTMSLTNIWHDLMAVCRDAHQRIYHEGHESMPLTSPLYIGSLIRFTYICCMTCLLNAYSLADERPIETLYRQYLANNNSNGLITFEREIIFPRPPNYSARASERSNNVRQINAPNNNIFSFCWEGSCFIIGCSSEAAVTNESAFASAKRLYGYDGQFYWRLLNDAVRTYINSKEERGFLPPLDSASILTVISKKETISAQGKYVANTTLSTINQLVAECRQVAQLGLSFPMEGQPTILNSNLIVVRAMGQGTQTVHLVGSAGHPDILNYDNSSNGMPVCRVSIDYLADTLVIDRFSTSGKRPVATIRYKVLSVGTNTLSKGIAMFTWETYKAAATKVTAEVAKNGATLSADITKDGELRPRSVLEPAKPLPGHANHPIYIYLLFIVVTCGFFTAIFLNYRKHK